jgi:hypothetical protein
MKILHTSHSGLPDPRIEKTALTMKKEGHDMLFLGGGPTKTGTMDVFDETFEVPMVNSLRLALDYRFRRRWIRAIEDIGPDVVHAHNIIASAMMFETDYPVIYDDHEYWSKQVFKFSERGFLRRLGLAPLARKMPKWERIALERYPVITVSEGIASEHRERGANVFITKNYPLLEEALELISPEEKSGKVYVGNDFELVKFLPHRDMTGLKDMIAFDVLKGLNHDVLMERLTHYNIGLTPWRSHPFHVYSEPNKHYEYLIAGLQVVITNSLMHPFKDEPYVHSFESYEDIPELLESLPEIEGGRIMEHARKRYIWENQERVIKNVYQKI